MNVEVSAVTTILDAANAYQVSGSPLLDSYDLEDEELVFRWIDHEGEYEQAFYVKDLAAADLAVEAGKILAKNNQGEQTWIRLFDVSPAKLSRSLVGFSPEDRGLLEPKPKTILVECYCADTYVDDAATHVALKLTSALCDRISLLDSARQALGCELIGEYVEAVWLKLDDDEDHDNMMPIDLDAQELDKMLVAWEAGNQVTSAPTEILIKNSGIVITSRPKHSSESCQVFSRTIFPRELSSSQVCFRR